MKPEEFKPTLPKPLEKYPTPRMDASVIELTLNGKWPATGTRKFVLAWVAQMLEAELMEMTDRVKELEAELAKSKEQVAFANKRVEHIEVMYDLLMIRYEQIEVELDGKKSEKIKK
jgi:predicted nuclease with TOPRIM domain